MRADGCTCGPTALWRHEPGCPVRPLKAGPTSEEVATRIAGLGPDDPRLPRAKAIHMVFCRITGWKHGKFAEWKTLNDDQREWWQAQAAFVVEFTRQFEEMR